MKTYHESQHIKQLEKRKGGYFYLRIENEIVQQLPNNRSTRLICSIDNEVSYRCGLNHLGDGNFFIIVAKNKLERLGKSLGDQVNFEIEVDPDQLGVEIPEVLSVLLGQDIDLKEIFERLTNGKKRSLIYKVLRTKDVDNQVSTIVKFLEIEGLRQN